jgi:hypothetical protein
MVIVDEGTIRTFRGKGRSKCPFLAHQLWVFFASARYRVVKIMHSCSEVVLWTTKNTMVYSGSGPSLEIIALRLRFDIEDEQWLQWGEHIAQKVHEVKGGMISSSLLPKGRVPFIDHAMVR